MEHRDQSIKIRVTRDEKERLQQRMIGGELARWMRETCLGSALKTPVDVPPVDPELLRQLAGIGNNLNQIARRVNAQLLPSDAIGILVALTQIGDAVRQLEASHVGKN